MWKFCWERVRDHEGLLGDSEGLLRESEGLWAGRGTVRGCWGRLKDHEEFLSRDQP